MSGDAFRAAVEDIVDRWGGAGTQRTAPPNHPAYTQLRDLLDRTPTQRPAEHDHDTTGA